MMNLCEKFHIHVLIKACHNNPCRANYLIRLNLCVDIKEYERCARWFRVFNDLLYKENAERYC